MSAKLILRPVQLIDTILGVDHSSWLLSVKLFGNNQRKTPHYHTKTRWSDFLTHLPFLLMYLLYPSVSLYSCSIMSPSNVKHWIIWWKTHQVKWGGLLRTTLAEGLIFVAVYQGEDNEEGVMRVLQACSTNQLWEERSEAPGFFFSLRCSNMIHYV